jgi:hypothetical protein
MTRIYGPKAKREWMKAKPCVVCVLVIPILAYSDAEWHSEICHVKTGGTGRKDDHERTWPGCRKHHTMYDNHEGFLGEPSIRAYIAGAAEALNLAWTTRTA